MPKPTDEELSRLAASAAAVRDSVHALTDVDFAAPSLLPGWTRAHVVAHLAGSVESRLRLLRAARRGAVGRQYPSEAARAEEIEVSAGLPPAALRARFDRAVDDFLNVVRRFPTARWDAPGQWLGVGRKPVSRTVPSMRREFEYHHVDLAAGYDHRAWPADFVADQLSTVVSSMRRRPDAPAVIVAGPDRSWRIGADPAVTVSGEPAALLAWLTGRGGPGGRRVRRSLRVAPAGPLPAMPPLS